MDFPKVMTATNYVFAGVACASAIFFGDGRYLLCAGAFVGAAVAWTYLTKLGVK